MLFWRTTLYYYQPNDIYLMHKPIYILDVRPVEKRITYVGWLGYGNVGDEALFEVDKKVFNRYELLPSLERPVSRITIFGGGTLLPHWGLTILPNKYNYVYGVGVRNPIFWGNPHPFLIDLAKRFSFRYIGVRDKTSQEILRKWGIHSEVIGDPCLLLESKSNIKKKENLIALNVGTAGGELWGHNEDQISKETVNLCKFLKEKHAYYPILIPFSKNDIDYTKRISELANVDIFENWQNIEEIVNFISSCHVLIGEKLHSIVLSASTYTPFISLEYRPKCRAFSELMGFSKYTIRTDEMSSGRVIKLLDELIVNWDRMRSKLIENVETYRKKLREAATKIMWDIRSLPDDKWSAPSLLQNRMRSIFYGADVYLFNHANSVWRAWYTIPIRRPVECCCSLIGSKFM